MDQACAFPDGADISKLDPLSSKKNSDSANLDEAVTLAIRSAA